MVQFLLIMMIILTSFVCVLFVIVERKSQISRVSHFWFSFGLLMFNVINCFILKAYESIFSTEYKLGVVQVYFNLEGFSSSLTAHILFSVAMLSHILCSIFSKTGINTEIDEEFIRNPPYPEDFTLGNISNKETSCQQESNNEVKKLEDEIIQLTKRQQKEFKCCEFQLLMSFVIAFVFAFVAIVYLSNSIYPVNNQEKE